MLGGMALKWRWRARQQAAGKPTDKPNMVMGANVQVCWEKFCRYWDVEPRLVPMEGDRYHLDAAEAVAALRREHHRRGRRCSGRRSTAATSRSPRSAPRSTRCRPSTGLDVPVHVDGASGGFIAPFLDPDLVWDFRLPARAVDQHVGPQVRPRVPGRRLGDLAQPRRAARRPRVQRELPRRRHADVRAELLAARQPDRRAVLQLPAPRLRGLPRACSRRRATSRRYLADAIGAIGPLRAHHRRQRAPGVRVHARRPEIQNYTVFDVSERLPRPRLAGARVHASPRTARTSPRSASSCATASRATSPSSWSPTSSATLAFCDNLTIAAPRTPGGELQPLMGRLDGKTVIVIGGAQGIGRGCVLAAAAEGARVVVGDLNEDGARDVAAEADRGAEPARSACAPTWWSASRSTRSSTPRSPSSGSLDGLVNLAYWHDGPAPIAELAAESLAPRAARRRRRLPRRHAGRVPAPTRARREHRQLQLQRRRRRAWPSGRRTRRRRRASACSAAPPPSSGAARTSGSTRCARSRCRRAWPRPSPRARSTRPTSTG